MKEGYTFDRWYSDSGFQEVYTFTTMPSSNITLYANWIELAELSEDIIYEIVDNEAIIISYTGIESILTIPDSISGSPVVKINDQAFIYNPYLENVVLGKFVSTIGNQAFYNCTGLISITIPNSMITIGENAFYNCMNLESIVLSEGVESIGNNAFAELGV